MSEQKVNPIICLLNCPNDASSKQLATSMKNVFPQNHLICSMKAAVDLATKGKTPVIKLPSTELSTISGNVVPLIVSNWIGAQLKKPAPKAAAKKAPPKKGGKGNAANSVSSEETPHQSENENQLPTFVYLTEYPKTAEQMKQLCSSSSPVICYIYVDYNPAVPQTSTETSRKGNQNAAQTPPVDWKEQFSSEIPFISINLLNQPENQNPDEVCTDLLKKVLNAYDTFQKYRDVFLDYRFISIPKYPKDILPIPQVAQEKPAKQPSGKGQNQPSISTQPTQIDSTKFGVENPLMNVYLKKAFQVTLFKQLESYFDRSKSPTFSPNFCHYSEFLPGYPLPASLALILSHESSKRVPELFTMRSLSYRTKMSYQIIENTLLIKKFEKLIGYSVGERRHVESIPLEFASNVLTPLLSFYGKFKWIDFAGKILLAFFNPIPDEAPVSSVEESFKLPLVEGFGSWFSSYEPSETGAKTSSSAEENEEPNDQDKGQIDPPQGESSSPAKTLSSIGINVGNNDMFVDFDGKVSTSSVTRYFCESGLRIETFPAEINDDLVSSLFFRVQYGSNTGPRLSFHVSQKREEIEGKAKNDEEEDDDDNVQTSVGIRGDLGLDTQCYLDLSSTDDSRIVLTTKSATVIFDVRNGQTVVTENRHSQNSPHETKRIITCKGDVIRYLSNGEIVIYRPDGSVQTRPPSKEWRIVDASGRAFVKKDGSWFKDEQHDQSCDVAESFFIGRKVTNWSHGVSFVEDDGELTIAFPDKTEYATKLGLFKHPNLPNIKVAESTFTVETSEFVATFSGKTRDCSIELKNNSLCIEYKKELAQLIIQYGQAKKVMTMIDIFTGIVANAGLNRCVYYLNDEFQWTIARQNCSQKEMMQHFQENDFVKNLAPVEKFDKEKELTQIITNGHKPRLFIIERDQSQLTASISIKELLDAAEFKSILESSANQISDKENYKVTLWFDTQPKSYREILITPKITEAEKNAVMDGIKEQKEIEDKKTKVLNSVADPKWAKLDAEQRDEEEKIQELLRKFKPKSDSNE